MLKERKQTKKRIFFLLSGFTIILFFVLLLLVNHINTLKIEQIYSTFTRNSSYEIVVEKAKNEVKRNLFDYENTHFYGYGIKDIGISYHGVTRNLKDILKTKKLSLEEFIEDFDLVYETEDKTITKYESEDFILTIEKFYGNNQEVIFSKKD